MCNGWSSSSGAPTAGTTRRRYCLSGSYRWCQESRGTGSDASVADSRSELERLEPPRQRHGVAGALHVDAVEEAHAEQHDIESLLYDSRVDVGELDIPEPDPVELHHVHGHVAIRGARHAALALVVVDAEAGGLGARQ